MPGFVSFKQHWHLNLRIRHNDPGIGRQTTLGWGHGLHSASPWGVPSPPSSPVSLPVSKGVEITLTAWWHQTTKEERSELCLSGCFFFSGAGKEQEAPTWDLVKSGEDGLYTHFSGSAKLLGSKTLSYSIAHCYMSSLGQPQGQYNTRLYPPRLSTRTLSGPSSQGTRTQQEGWAGQKWPVHLPIIYHQSPWRVGTVPLSSLYSQHLAGAGLQLLVKVC